MARLKLGDVYEVRTGRGLAYVQHVLDSDFIGAFVRVIPGFFDETPPEDIVQRPSRLLVSYPLAAAVKKGLVRRVFSGGVPAAYDVFPVMRAGGTWLWDGEREWQEPELGEEHRRLPHRDTIVHDTLVGYIEAEIGDEDLDDEGEPRRAVAYPSDSGASARSHDEPGQHYLYFAQRKKAERARKVIEERGFATTLRESADADDWLLLVTVKDDIEAEAELLERIAVGNDGEYDGSEVAVG